EHGETGEGLGSAREGHARGLRSGQHHYPDPASRSRARSADLKCRILSCQNTGFHPVRRFSTQPEGEPIPAVAAGLPALRSKACKEKQRHVEPIGGCEDSFSEEIEPLRL